MNKPESLEIREKQEAHVEAANALLFLQNQGRYSPQEERPEANGGESLSPSSFHSIGEDDQSDEEFGTECKKAKFDAPHDELKFLRNENQALRDSVEKMSLSESSLKNDPEKVNFYTGLPNLFMLETLMWLLNTNVVRTRSGKLSRFQQLLMTLICLRLNLPNQDLAYRFGVKVPTVTKLVHRMINVMYTALVPSAVIWPSREELRKNLPDVILHEYPDCVAIIDCLTVPLQEPVTQGNQSGSAGSMLRYLISVAPQGVVTFVSPGMLGNVSNKNLVEASGFLDKVLPGDVILAPRDLGIEESVTARGARFQVTGQEQSSEPPKDTVRVHAHVERMINTVKRRYAILTGPVESPFANMSAQTNISIFDKIVRVACALNNLCISISPLER